MLEKIPRAMALGAMIVVSSLVCSPPLLAAPESTSASGVPSIEMKTAGMRHMPGFLPLHWDEKNGRLYLEIPQLNADMLYFDSLPYGTGSNDLGLDRGQVSAAKLVRFERFGPKILLVRPNQYFRSSAKDPAEQLAVRQYFPESISGRFSRAMCMAYPMPWASRALTNSMPRVRPSPSMRPRRFRRTPKLKRF